MTMSQPTWPADFGNYGPLFIRLVRLLRGGEGELLGGRLLGRRSGGVSLASGEELEELQRRRRWIRTTGTALLRLVPMLWQACHNAARSYSPQDYELGNVQSPAPSYRLGSTVPVGPLAWGMSEPSPPSSDPTGLALRRRVPHLGRPRRL